MDATSAMQSIQIVATDIADGMLARVAEKLETRPRYQRFRSHVSTVQMDGQLLDKLADSSVDIVGSNFGLSIFPDRNLAWRSAARVLRDGGVLFATVWDAQSPNLRWADATVDLTREIELEQAAAKSAAGEEIDGPADASSPPPLFVPSLRAGHGGIESEVRAAGFRSVEMHCTQHSIDVSSAFVDALFNSPVFIERVGRDRHAQLWRSFMESEVAKQSSAAPTSGPSNVAQQANGLPTALSFVAHTLIAIK